MARISFSLVNLAWSAWLYAYALLHRGSSSAAEPISNWKAEDGEVMRMEVPLWLMRFSSLNIFSQLGLTPEKLRLTVQDIERYGPGVVVDYNQPGAARLLMWVD